MLLRPLARLVQASLLVLLGVAPAAAVTVDFDDLTAGTPVSVLDDLTLSVDPASVGLEVGTGLGTTSGANYLAAAMGDGSFLSGDVIRLDFAAPVRSLSLAVISTMGTAPGAFTLFSDAGTNVSGAPDSFLGMDEVYLLSIEPGTSFDHAELRAAAGGLFAFNVDDIVYAVPEPGAPLVLAALVLAGRQRRGRSARIRSTNPKEGR